MKVEIQVSGMKGSSPFVLFGRVVVFAAVASAVYALAKPLLCARLCKDYPCHKDGESAWCSNQDEPAESAKGCTNKENQEMTSKKDAQFSFEECSCEEMMSQLMPQSKGRQEATAGCAEMIAQCGGSRDGGEILEMMSRMMTVFCDAGQESDEILSKA